MPATPENYCYVTLLTSDSYIPGALVLANSLRAYGTKYPLVAVVTNDSVSPNSVNHLRSVYNDIVFVDTIRSTDKKNLDLLGRSELDITFTKIHVWNPDVIKYSRFVFFDSDVLVTRNVDELFSYVDGDIDFAAAPDCGWPDIFNSGVFVTKPNRAIYDGLMNMAMTEGSFDGADQGLLNQFFSNWAQSSDGPFKTNRLPFVFNVTPSSVYSYLPAFQQFEQNIAIVHFIGEMKPWKWDRFSDGKIVPKSEYPYQTTTLVQKWWDIFDKYNVAKILSISTETGPVSGWNVRSNYPSAIYNGEGPKKSGNGYQIPDFANYHCEWNENEFTTSQKLASVTKVKKLTEKDLDEDTSLPIKKGHANYDSFKIPVSATRKN